MLSYTNSGCYLTISISWHARIWPLYFSDLSLNLEFRLLLAKFKSRIWFALDCGVFRTVLFQQ